MNCNVQGNGIRDAVGATSLVGQVQFNGLTPLGTQLDQKVIRPFLVPGVQGRNLAKPILVGACQAFPSPLLVTCCLVGDVFACPGYVWCMIWSVTERCVRLAFCKKSCGAERCPVVSKQMIGGVLTRPS